jgi:hypothetical protein
MRLQHLIEKVDQNVFVLLGSKNSFKDDAIKVDPLDWTTFRADFVNLMVFSPLSSQRPKEERVLFF